MPDLRVIFVFPRIAPWRIPLLNALARTEGIHIRVIYLCRRRRRPGIPLLDEIDHPFSILSHRALRQESLTWGGLLPRRLMREAYQVLVVPRGSHPAYAQAILLGRVLKKKVILWCEGPARRAGWFQGLAHGSLSVPDFMEPAGEVSRRIIARVRNLASTRS